VAEKPGGDRIGMISLALTALPVLVAMFRILSMAHWDYTLVPVVLKSADFGAVAINSLFSSLHIVAVVSIGLVVLAARKGLVRTTPAFVAINAISVLSIFLVPALYSVLIILATFPAIYSLRTPTRPLSTTRKVTLVISVLLYSYVMVNHLGANGRFWLPAEIIETVDQQKLVAHVVESGDHDLTFIAHDTRRPEILRQDSVRGRTLCTLTDVRPGTIGDVLVTPAYKLAIHRKPNPPLLPRCRP
jgi:hypothetical protein